MSTTPRTIIVGITPGQSTASYTLAPGLAQYVQSVYVEVDNTAGADTRPLLTVSEQSGVVIAKKRQGESITAGTSGSATWALRLTDETAASGTAAGFIRYVFANTGSWLSITTTGTGPSGDGVFFNDSGGGFKFVATNPVFGELLVQVPFVHLLTANNDLRLQDNGDATWNGQFLTLTYAAGVEIDTNGGDVLVDLNAAGDKFVVNDSGGNPIFTLTG